MRIVAVPVLDSKDAAWAAARIIALHRREPSRFHLVNVRPAFSRHVCQFFSASYLQRVHREDAEQFLAPVAKALDKAGVPYRIHVLVGRKAERIAEFVENYPCRELLVRNESRSLLRLGLESINSGIRRKLRALYPEGKVSLAGLR